MIPYGRQSIDDQDLKAVIEALQSDYLTTGPLVEKFEKAIEKRVGAPTVVVSSGTAALHAAYAAIGVTHGDEIITPPITFVATQATAALLGAKIVFADVVSATGNIDPRRVEEAISSKTKAIVAVDFAGNPAQILELRELAHSRGIYLIEDAAHSIGAFHHGHPVGSIADLTTFSFYPTKNLTTGEGGAVSSNNSVLLNRVRRFARQGLVREKSEFIVNSEGEWHQEVHEFGLNYRLPDLLCALGISQISKLDKFKEMRRQVFEGYQYHLEGISQIKLPKSDENNDPMWHLFPLRVPSAKRREIFDLLRSKEIGVQVNYLPAHLHPVFKISGYTIGSFPEAEKFYNEEISLPIWPGLEGKYPQVFETIANVLKSVLN